MQPERVQGISKMPYPASKRQLQSLLGCFNYFRSFIPKYAQTAEPLYMLLRKGVRFNWGTDQANAVDTLKEKLIQSPKLLYPDFTKPFVLSTDASDNAVASCLFQTDKEGLLRPLAFSSQCLSGPQRKYSTTKKEFLAVLVALEKFRNIVLNYEVTVYTDHRPLLGLMKRVTKDPCPTRWALLIQEYKVQMYYLPGKDNILADALSRLSDLENVRESLQQELDDALLDRIGILREGEDSMEGLNAHIPVKSPWTHDELKNAQLNDDGCKHILKVIRGEVERPHNVKVTSFRIINEVIFVHRVVKRSGMTEEYLVPMVPQALLNKAFEVIHTQMTAGHPGRDQTLRLFRRNFYHPNESKQVNELVRQCTMCIRSKAIPKNIPIKSYPIPGRPFQTLSSDILGPLPVTSDGNRFILTFKCHLTRYTTLHSLATKDTMSIAKAFRINMSHYGPPETLLTDNAPEYKSEMLSKFCSFYNIRKVEIAPYHPSSQGLVERVNREVTKYLRIYTYEVGMPDWDRFLPTIQLAINNTYNRVSRDSPFRALYGYDSPTVSLTPPKLDYGEDEMSTHLNHVVKVRQHVAYHLARGQVVMNASTNTKRKGKDIAIGDTVYANLRKYQPQAKLTLPISGPLKVTEKKGAAYNLVNLSDNKQYLVHPDLIITNDRQDNENESETDEVNPPEACPKPKEKGLKPTSTHSYNLRPRK